jgi:hypothetical protein
MRSSIIAAFTASAVLAMTSIVSAQTTQQSSDTPNVPANSANSANNPDYGMTAAQENAIPYRACSNAVGWVHGHLVCRNN